MNLFIKKLMIKVIEYYNTNIIIHIPMDSETKVDPDPQKLIPVAKMLDSDAQFKQYMKENHQPLPKILDYANLDNAENK